MTGSTSGWLACSVSRPDAPRRLVCLPHAGGSAAFFHDWGRQLPNLEVHAACYPGRAGRLREQPPADLVELAQGVAQAVLELSDRPIGLFGHSMGAPIALEVARALEQAGAEVDHLFASGSRPGPVPDRPPEPDSDPDELFGKLIQLGGTDPELADDPEFRELVLPYLQGDERMFRTYRMTQQPTVHCPVTCIVGDNDAEADQRPWPTLTLGGFGEWVVPGDHFYLSAQPPYQLINEQWK